MLVLDERAAAADPRAVDVVAPEQMIGDHASCRVHDSDRPFEREPLVPLQV
jgi:hypothetical protein